MLVFASAYVSRACVSVCSLCVREKGKVEKQWEREEEQTDRDKERH